MSALLADLIPWLLGAAAAIAAIMGYGARQRVKGRREAETAALQDSAARQEEGRDAVQGLRGAGRDDLLDRLRRNDGRW